MEKKEYMTPAICVLAIGHHSMICSSDPDADNTENVDDKVRTVSKYYWSR